MGRETKVIRDPLYDYITIDIRRDGWLLKLLDTAEFQRLRRIAQLGVSTAVYPGATHTRLGHSLGVTHLMRLACDHLERASPEHFSNPDAERTRRALLACALLHDLGHGPFSHLFEDLFEGRHEDWSVDIIKAPDTEVNERLRSIDEALPEEIENLFSEAPTEPPQPWEKHLLGSELDVDRLDYLRRDSYFTGAGYGRFDYLRLINSMTLGEAGRERQVYPLWPDKSKYAIEEYIFSRFYMYRAVYVHPTTRAYEKLLGATFRRARQLAQQGDNLGGEAPVVTWLRGERLSVSDYLALEDAVIVGRLLRWESHSDSVLSDLSQRFLRRRGLKPFEVEPAKADLERTSAINQAKGTLRRSGYEPDYYLLEDKGETRHYRPYRAEQETDEQTPMTSIMLQYPERPDNPIQELSEALTRVRHVAGTAEPYHYMFCPEEHRESLRRLINGS